MTSTTWMTDTIRLRLRPSAATATLRDTVDLPLLVAEDEAERQHGSRDGIELVVPRPGPVQRLTVRTFDVVVALIGLVVLAPLMLLVAVAVMLDSPGPILYGSERIGHAKPTFRAWKFRSMRPDADDVLGEILAGDDDAWTEYETYHKLRHDPRLTRVGSVIRQTSLDELPQLFNILIGQMSVVGPRPKLAKDAESYGDALAPVLAVRPGLTGLWQISGRSDLPMAERVALDLRYVTTRTLRGDLAICVRTFIQLWQPGRNGAY